MSGLCHGIGEVNHLVTEGMTSEDQGKVLELRKTTKNQVSNKMKIIFIIYLFLLPKAHFEDFVVNRLNNSQLCETL